MTSTWPWLTALVVLAGAPVAGLVLHWVIMRLVRRVIFRHTPDLAQSIRVHCTAPLQWLVPSLTLYFAASAALADPARGWARDSVSVLLILALGWFLARLMRVVEDVLGTQLGLDAADNLAARKFQTQFRILRRAVVAFIFFAAAATVLLRVEAFRQLGTGLLASAGIAGIIVGLAAQRALGNLLAGFQLAITQPIRLDDVVVVEGEWGKIEEITLTYVVVRIWDLRRLMLPISYFLERPFTNWTRSSSDLLGTVFLHADYTVPVPALRAELRRIAEASEHWDGKVCGLLVTDAKETTLELRALVSAADGSSAWNLRCEVREKLIGFLRDNHPDSLPRVRLRSEGNRQIVASDLDPGGVS